MLNVLKMVMTKGEAYDILELPVGADQDSIRTSYKRLALKWHPDKHNNSTESVRKFQDISRAYKRLTGDGDDDAGMSLNQMMKLFKDVFFARTINSYNGSGCDSSDDDDDDDYDDDGDIEDDVRISNLFPDKFRLNKVMKRARSGDDSSYKHLTADEINKNAEELITEEEKEKRRAEKRKAKKKRRREKKKLEKMVDSQEDKKGKQKNKETENNLPEKNKGKKSDKREDSSSSDETGFDPNSAFFTKVVNKKKKAAGSDQPSRRDKSKQGSDDDTEDLDPVVLRSRQLAIKGNEMAQLGHYTAAIELFTEAIKLDPHDFRFFGNRSYCFDRIKQYDRALKDAEKAIALSKDWPKGYFRKGRALAGLRMFREAEEAFTQVLKLDKNCDDAVQELSRVRIYQITEMGFTRSLAEAAIKEHETVSSALDSLLAGVAENALGGEVYVSDDESGAKSPTAQRPTLQKQKSSDTKMDPRNPEGLTALWVGNVLPEKVDDKKLLKIFSKYGSVTSVRCLPEKYCAFINYKTKEAAGKAMQYLQGAECGGQRLLIKFPDNPIVNGGTSVTIRKSPAQQQPQQPQQPKQIYVGKALSSAQSNVVSSSSSSMTAAMTAASAAVPVTSATDLPKQSGPVNGDECYFWRTTGCTFGDKCRNKHIPDHRGIDRKPWQKV